MALVKPLVRQSLRLSPIVPAPRRVIRTSSPRPWKVGWAATMSSGEVNDDPSAFRCGGDQTRCARRAKRRQERSQQSQRRK